MIEDSKFVKSVTSNAPKKGWKITWEDDKYDNIFNEAWLPILDQAEKEHRLVHTKKEKNQQGYWNIQHLELATLEATPQPAPEYPKENKEDLFRKSPNAGFALSYAKDMMLKTLSEGEDIKAEKIDHTIMLAEAFRMYMDGELKFENPKLAKLINMIVRGNQ